MNIDPHGEPLMSAYEKQTKEEILRREERSRKLYEMRSELEQVANTIRQSLQGKGAYPPFSWGVMMDLLERTNQTIKEYFS